MINQNDEWKLKCVIAKEMLNEWANDHPNKEK